MAALLTWPVAGPVISGFGAARDGGARSHEGIDIGSPVGTAVGAAASGRVLKAGQISSTAGLGVEIQHDDGTVTKYFHLSQWFVSVGQYVAQGQVIGLVGKTGNAATTAPHLHFEVWANGRAIDPQTILQAGVGAVNIGGLSVSPKVILAALIIILILR